jgi:hypothetical protein
VKTADIIAVKGLVISDPPLGNYVCVEFEKQRYCFETLSTAAGRIAIDTGARRPSPIAVLSQNYRSSFQLYRKSAGATTGKNQEAYPE